MKAKDGPIVALHRRSGRIAAGLLVAGASLGAFAPRASAATHEAIYPGAITRSLGSQVLGGTNDQIAFQANTGQLWTAGSLEPVGNAGSLGMMPGTNPAITGLSDGGYEVAFQSNIGQLWVYGTEGTGDLNLGMAPGTSPSITEMPAGNFEIAFQSNVGQLWTFLSGVGGTNTGLGMLAGTSPSIVSLASGYQVAFQANTGQLWTTGTATPSGNAGSLAMAPGTSPSITAVLNGGDGNAYEVAYQSASNDLSIYGSAGTGDQHLGMLAGTSPSVAGLIGGGWEAAFTANTGQLWTAGTVPGSGNAGSLGVAPGTSPSISALNVIFPLNSSATLNGTGVTGGGFLVAFNALGGNLWTFGANGATGSLGLGMLAKTSPSLIGF